MRGEFRIQFERKAQRGTGLLGQASFFVFWERDYSAVNFSFSVFFLSSSARRFFVRMCAKSNSAGVAIHPFSTAVPMWGQTSLIPSDLCPKRDRGPNRVSASVVVIAVDRVAVLDLLRGTIVNRTKYC